MTRNLINVVIAIFNLVNGLSVTYAKGEIVNYINPILEIQKINLSQEFYPSDKEKNNVNKNIQVINEFKVPSKENNNIILAAHSGTAKISYFKRLDEVSINDTVYLYYKKTRYKYVVGDIYDVEKTGYVQIKRDKSKNTLTLITCRKGTNKQIVVIAYLTVIEKI